MVGKRQSDRWRRHKSTLPEVNGRRKKKIIKKKRKERGNHESDKAETNENKRLKGALLSLNTQIKSILYQTVQWDPLLAFGWDIF